MKQKIYKAREDREYGVVFDYFGRYTEDQLFSAFASDAYRKIERPTDEQKNAEYERILKVERIRWEEDVPDYVGKKSPLKINSDGHLVDGDPKVIQKAKEQLKQREEDFKKQREAYTLREQYKATKHTQPVSYTHLTLPTIPLV